VYDDTEGKWVKYEDRFALAAEEVRKLPVLGAKAVADALIAKQIEMKQPKCGYDHPANRGRGWHFCPGCGKDMRKHTNTLNEGN